MQIFAVIMAGGFGTRFWPASRKTLPKQFLPIGGKRALIAETAARLKGLVDPEHTLVVTGRDHVALVRKFLRKVPPENVLAEPCGRNTAPCVAWAAAELERRGGTSVQIVLPSDHVIQPARDFRKLLRAACEEALETRALCTLGVRPSFPATGYGYIEAAEELGKRSGAAVRRVARFVEKPDRARAEEFLASGRFFWNAGIFVWRTDAILAAMELHARDIVTAVRGIRSAADAERIYPTLPSAPIDVAVMEKADNVRVLPIEFTWSDVGSWAALPEVVPADAQGNFASGGASVLAHDSTGCVVHGKAGEIVALVGVKDLVVVRAGKALLVMPRERAQDVKHVVTRLEREGPTFL
ncbi:MAG: mannose-1-phosphate guanylyltransferase [Planctomycetes bacterium]|nr:mannose-1-phosphate guanylyltransferase [Planctomycetota bacterium]